MKRKTAFLPLLLALLSVAGCQPSTSQTSQSPSQTPAGSPTNSDKCSEDESYYLIGNNGSNGELTLDDGTPTIEGVALHRGDSFAIEGKERYGYDDIAESGKAGFEKGKDGSAIVLIEGVYTISINDGKIHLVKTDSVYSKVELVTNDARYPFVKQADFSFLLEDAPLRYREKFIVEADEDVFAYESLSPSDALKAGFYKDGDKIVSEWNGTFDFRLDFTLTDPLIISSDTYREPTPLLKDESDFAAFLDILPDQVEEEATSTTLVIIDEDIENKTEIKDEYLTVRSLNQSYEKQTETYLEETSSSTRAEFFDEKQYYQLTVKDNGSGQADGVRIVESEDQDGYTEEKARKQVAAFSGQETVFLNSTLGQLIKGSYLNDSQIPDYQAGLDLECVYAGEVGEALQINAHNIEFATVNSALRAFEYEAEILTDDQGRIVEAEFFRLTYSSSAIEENDDGYLLKETAEPIEKKTANFLAEYGKKTMVDAFILDPAVYYVSTVFAVGANLEVGKTFDETDLGLIYLPATALDKDNFSIVDYDEDYIRKNYANYSVVKAGQTALTIGNGYNDVKASALINAVAPAGTKIEVTDMSYNSAYFAGQTYQFKSTVSPTYAIQTVEVVSLTPDIAEVSNLTPSETGSYYVYDVKFLKEGEAKIKVTSTENANLTTTLTYQVEPELTLATLAGDYITSDEDDYPHRINIDDAGRLTIDYGDSNLVQAELELQGNKLALKGTHTEISAITATIYAGESLRSPTRLSSFCVYYQTGSGHSNISYETFYRANPYQGTFLDEEHGASLSFTYSSYSSLNQGEGVITIGKRTINFDWTFLDGDTYVEATSISEFQISDTEGMVTTIKVTAVSFTEITLALNDINGQTEEYHFTRQTGYTDVLN